jgi:hypothetical protein
MKKTEVLFDEAREIMKKELLSCAPNTSFGSRASKQFRRFFMSSCMDEMGTPFTSRIKGYVATGLTSVKKDSPILSQHGVA